MERAMAVLPALLFLLLAASISTACADDGVSGSTPAPAPNGCSIELVMMSPCLPHIAASPDDATAEPSSACCETFFSALDSAGGGPACLCYLVREPFLLGFPVNASRLASLFSSCGGSSPTTATAFIDLCRGPEPLPPLRDQMPPGDADESRRRTPPAPHVRRPPPSPPNGHSHNPSPSPPGTWEPSVPATPISQSGGNQSLAAPVLFLLPIIVLVCGYLM